MLEAKQFFLAFMSLVIIGMFSAYPEEGQADEIPICEYLWGVTPQHCKWAFQSSHAGNGGGWRPRCFIYDDMRWNQYMLDVDTDLITPQGEAWLERLKTATSPEHCACDIRFRCEKDGFSGGIGGYHTSEWIRHECKTITIGEIRKLTADTKGNFYPQCD